MRVLRLPLIIHQLLICYTVFAQNSSAEPKVKIGDGNFNFGKTYQQVVLTHTFWIKSVGTDTLKILEIEPGCSCTQLPLKDSTIAPGDSIDLGIIFHTGRMRGNIAKAPYVVTNAAADRLYFKIYAEALTDSTQSLPICFVPSVLDVSQFTEKPRRRSTFKIENRSTQDYTIKVVDTTKKSFELTLPNKIKAGESIEGSIMVRKELVPTSFQESFTIAINDDLNTRFTMSVFRLYKPRPADTTPTNPGTSGH